MNIAGRAMTSLPASWSALLMLWSIVLTALLLSVAAVTIPSAVAWGLSLADRDRRRPRA